MATGVAPKPAPGPYHHGDLRRALLGAALEVLDEVGPSALSLREVARRAGVSHAAPAHHFGDKSGLLTAIAIEGFELLIDELAAQPNFLEVGVGYVRFAIAHRSHFDVMFRPELQRRDDARLLEVKANANALLYPPAGSLDAGVAAWSLVHGFATLWIDGALPDVGGDPEQAIRRLAAALRP